jgi:hypothetical protein
MLTIKLPRRGQAALAKEMEKLLRFLDADIGRVQAVDDQSVEVSLASGAPVGPEKAQTIEAIVLEYVRGYKDFKAVVVGESAVRAEACICPHEFDHHEVAQGVRTKSGAYLDLHRFLLFTFDRLFARFRPYRLGVPSMISRELIERLGYFKKFPNLANFVVNLKKDYQLIKDASTGAVSLGEDLLQHVDASDKMLNPVTCYHIYPQANRLLEGTGRTTYVIDGTAYRYESHNMSRTRLNEFHIHEIVYFGSKSEVEAQRREILRLYVELFDAWGLDFRAETSSDIFYANDAATYIATQKLEGAKIEINGKTDTGYHSFVSLNLHGTHYTKVFDIRVPGVEEAHSGCAGHGMERLIHVIYAQLGQDPERWPKPLQAAYAAFVDAWGGAR